ncbi:MAG TPA: hypothetical protein VKB05_15970 [Pyrinomonadaceae bacterium]|nr:hypothetical protein [Pyrinomonadaceae bacterium]
MKRGKDFFEVREINRFWENNVASDIPGRFNVVRAVVGGKHNNLGISLIAIARTHMAN